MTTIMDFFTSFVLKLHTLFFDAILVTHYYHNNNNYYHHHHHHH